jgi:hypothetical protein
VTDKILRISQQCQLTKQGDGWRARYALSDWSV